MSLPGFSVKRPIFTSMIAILIIILGVVSLDKLPVDLLPDIERSVINVSTTYEDASPQEVEESVTRPLELAMSAVSGVKEIRSSSNEGMSSIDVEFTWGTNLDAATGDIRDRIDRTLSSLPDEVSRPMVRKFDSAQIPVIMLGFSSDMDLLVAKEYVEDHLQYRLERLPGVASTTIRGGGERKIFIDLNFDKIKALNLSFNQLLERLKKGNINTPGGNIEEGKKNIRVRIPGNFANLKEIQDTVVCYANGAPIRIHDIATVTSQAARRDNLNRVNFRDTVRIVVYKQSGANTVEVADAVYREMNIINKGLPQGKLVMLFDTSEYIRQSISSVTEAALYGGILALLVLLFFLRNIRSTLVVALSIPISIMACFTLIYFFGFSINIMSLGGLALGIGMLVDNSIVVLENITHHYHSGDDGQTAAERAASEMSSPILASTLTTVVVFLPLLFIAGMSGVMFRELAIVVTFSLLCSYFAALTLVPMLTSRFLSSTFKAPPTRRTLKMLVIGFCEKAQLKIELFYVGLLAQAIRHRFVTILLVLSALGGSLLLIPWIGTELMPKTDESEVRVYFEMAPGTRLDILEEKIAHMEKIIVSELRERELRILQVSGGGGGHHGSGSNQGTFRVKLSPRTERKRSSQDIATDLSRALKNIPGVSCRTRVRSSIIGRIIGGSGEDTIDIDVRGHDFEIGRMLAEQIAERAKQLPGVLDTKISIEEGVPERNIIIDRTKAAALGLSVEDVADALRILITGDTAGVYRIGGSEYDIVIRGRNVDKMSIRDILDVTIVNRFGNPVVLNNVLNEKVGVGPLVINRKDRERVVTVSVNAPDQPAGTMVEQLRKAISDLPIPNGFAILFSGAHEEQQRSFRELLFSLALAIILVYIVMACQFESLVEPFIVMFSVPLGIIGVILTLLLTDTTFNLQSFIGCIILTGIVVNNAILLVDQINRLYREEGMDIVQAVCDSGRRRLRPIMMTMLTTCLGLVPMAIGIGSGEAQAPMARTVIGGLFCSTFITLLFIPVVYSLVMGGLEKIKKRRTTAKLPPENA